MFDLTGKSALVTGASGGIGADIARALHGAGATVGLSGTRLEPLEALASELGERAHVLPCNLSDADAVSALPKQAAEAMGAVDILVNNAGITRDNLFMRMSDEEWQSVIDVNLGATFRLCKGVLRGMMKARWGRIINIGSTAAHSGWKDNPAYCASKSGLLGLTRCLALEGAEYGVTSVMVSPTWVKTELMRRDVAEIMAREGLGRSVEEGIAEIEAQNPQKRMIDASEIAELVCFLCSEAARGITMEDIAVTGGATW